MTLSDAPGPRARENTPFWMETSPTNAQPQARRGVAPKRGSGTSTLVFFGLIVVGVVAAGLLAIALWGPEKPIANRSHHATQPSAPVVMPSLPEATEAPAAAEAPAPPPAADSAAPAPAPLKKAKRTVAAPKSKHR